MESAASFDTTNLLRPHQVAEGKEELANIEATLSAPPHIRSRISDVGQMRDRHKRLKTELEKYTPRAFLTGERDAALKEFATLEDQIKAGMPSSEEMRRNPPGAVSKHRAWESENTPRILRYKNIGLRLAAGGDLPAYLKHAGDISNIERLRPRTTSHQLAMDGAQIPKVAAIHIGQDPAGTVVFSPEEEAKLKLHAPKVHGSLAVLDNDARAELKSIVGRLLAEEAPAAAAAVAETAPAGKPGPTDLTFNQMRAMAFKAGIPDARKMKKIDLIVALRNRDLIR